MDQPLKKPTKLNIASGKDYRKGYFNVDNNSMGNHKVDLRASISELRLENNYFTEILVSHFMMYVDTFEAPILFKRWYDWLTPGGELIIETGDLKKIVKTILYSEDPKIINGTNGVMQLFGWAETKGHTWAWCYETLEPLLLEAGFKTIKRIDGGSHNRPERDITITAIK